MNKQKLIDKIRTAEGFNDEEKSSLLELLRKQKKYGLVWEDKPEEIEARLQDELPVLVPKEGDKNIISDDPDAPNHILIEGDNLEALTTLAYTHAGKIDVIYIDPPYNTGNKDFIYNDSYVDTEDGYRHSKWLSFMNKRLKIAKQLLSDKGVIFISIDDNEQAQLKLLCDEIFPGNFINDLIWQKKFSRSNDATYFSSMHDHILCFVKSTDREKGWKIGLLDREAEIPKGYSNPDNDPRGPWTSVILSAKSGGPSLMYEITTPSGRKCLPPDGRYWSCSKETFEQWNNDKRIWFGKNGDGTPRKKTFLSEVQGGLRPNTMLFHTEAGHNQEARQELKDIFGGEGRFDGPKPTRLISLLLKIANDKNARILDFFAGSGTTLHATMQLNAEDGGHRKCIIVTNNENGICENVTYERNKRVIQGYTTPKGEQVAGLTNNNLRYYKTDFVGRNRTNKNMKELVTKATDMLCIKNDVYNEAPLCGKKLSAKIARYFEDGDKRMLVVYEADYIDDIATLLLDAPKGKQKIKTYVFSPSEYAWDDQFIDVADRVELCALPDAIYKAYRDILPKRKVQLLADLEPEDRNTAEAETYVNEQTELNFDEEGGEA